MKIDRRLLLARRVGKAYLPGHWALRGIDLEVPDREFAAILGPPGSGKTTLLRLLAFLERPSEGELFWEGRLVTGLSDAETADLRSAAVHLLAPEEVGTAAAGLPPLLLADVEEPAPDLLPFLHRRNAQGHAVLIATADPEIAAACRTIYRLNNGLIRLISPREGYLCEP